MNIKNILDNYASIYLATKTIMAQIYTGNFSLTFMTHTNHKMIFQTNARNQSPSMTIEENGEIIIYKNLHINTMIKTPLLETNTTLLKLKGGSSGTQILDSSDTPIINISCLYFKKS